MKKLTVLVSLLAFASAQIGPGVPDSRCPEGTPEPPLHLNDPTDCRRFFKCENSLAVPFECPAGQHWSVRADACDWPNRAQCVLELPVTCPPENPPWPEEPIHLAHPTDCTQFFKCNWGTPHQMSCPPGQHWSVADDWCDWPDRANCEAGNGDGGGDGGGSGECKKSKSCSKESNSREV